MSVATSGRVAVVAPGNAWAPRPRRSLVVIDQVRPGVATDTTGCEQAEQPVEDSDFAPRGVPPESTEDPSVDPADDAFVGVAALASGRVLAQVAERTELSVDASSAAQRLSLGGGVATNVGHRFFHMSTDTGVACVSCHPDGSDDGHIWNFRLFGKRRTQTLRGGVSARRAFHWDASLPDFGSLVHEVFGSRMGLRKLPNEIEQRKLLAYLDALPQPARAASVSPQLVERGAALFRDKNIDCGRCHSGERFTDGKVYDVGTGGSFLTPSLLGVGTRAPYLHDGCAPDLRARFGACGGGDKHGRTSQLSDDELDALIAFLRTL